MSLLCDETRKDIEFGQPLKAGTRKDVDWYSALGPDVIKKIPASAKRKNPCRGKQGVDIHEATSTRNLNGSYTLCDFTRGKFLFSLSQKDADKYLPNHMSTYPKLTKKKESI
jgi:hypothetical protein